MARRYLVRSLVGGAQRALEASWAIAFDTLGRLRPSTARPLQVGDGAAVLVVAPHPDDEVAGCGGTIAGHREAGDRVTIAYVTDGRRSLALGGPPDRTAQVRRREAEAAAALLDADAVWLGAREGETDAEVLARRLAEVLASAAPTVVYAPSRVDFHPEHKVVAHALAVALAQRSDGGGAPVVRVFQVQVPLASPLANRFCDITAAAPKHDRALAAHASQVGSLVRCRRMKRYAAGRHGGAGLAEEFWEMPAERYVALHRTPPGGWSEHFRALRYLALTDPAAYSVGRAARLRLLNHAAR